jgi:D-aspartate ligase
MGCTDEYAEFIIDFQERLNDLYIIPYADKELKDKLVDKADFYKMCESFSIPYPKTVVVDSPCKAEELSEESLGFCYPIIIKPSSSIEYWHHPFDGMQKVYFSENAEQSHQIIETIYKSGYDRRIILQDTVPGGDSDMRVFTVYMDRNAKAKMLCLGHVLLEEHTPKGRGNHAAIITEPPLPICEKLVAMLEALEYRGFANFDIKYDSRDGEYKVFEINIRQGRSNHYITASGINVASLVVRDRIFEEDFDCIVQREEFFWHSVPKRVVYTYTDRDELVEKCKKLCKCGKEGSPFITPKDLNFNPMRLVFVTETLRRQFGKYAKYCKKMR